MSAEKKKVRANFRNRVFQRDQYCCKICGIQSTPKTCLEYIDAHHIIPREEMTNGGYVRENGITLCKFSRYSCHFQVESGKYTREQLFQMIGSSEEEAREADERSVLS